MAALLLTRLDLGLQVCRRVKILALLPGAAALDVVHADGDGVVRGVDHGAVTGVSKAAVRLPSRTAAALKLAAHLREGRARSTVTRAQQEPPLPRKPLVHFCHV